MAGNTPTLEFTLYVTPIRMLRFHSFGHGEVEHVVSLKMQNKRSIGVHCIHILIIMCSAAAAGVVGGFEFPVMHIHNRAE